ncbi:SH3 domain-containing protein [Pseudoponticoccus marisrubri]|nr:SH3 domain-containing protein [Pseudoponticoccus marisrubri]
MILVTFGVLGWAWFELSGGTDFEPGQNGVQVLAQVETEQTQPAAPQQPTERVARTTATNPVSLSNVAALGMPLLDTASQRPPFRPGAEPGNEQVAMLQNASLRTDAAPEPVVTEAVSIDYRVVTGSRVNLRGGPSTGYGVVTQLLRGEEVEVLDDTGDGWVKLRALDGDNVGWMSDAFLEAAN